MEGIRKSLRIDLTIDGIFFSPYFFLHLVTFSVPCTSVENKKSEEEEEVVGSHIKAS